MADRSDAHSAGSRHRPVKRIACTDAAADVLRGATLDGLVLTLPPERLDRRLYEEINKVLAALGGKWNRKAAGHVFATPPDLASVLDAGEVVVPQFGFFPTPAPLAARLVEMAGVEPCHTVLEPSAGTGAIADVLAAVAPAESLHLVEIQPQHCATLRASGYQVIEADFLTVDLPTFDRIVMNPPFERRQDIAHVERAFDLLRPGGRLVSVMSAGVQSGSDRRSAAFHGLVADAGWAEPNAPEAFKESGTNVQTITVVLNKPMAALEAA